MYHTSYELKDLSLYNSLTPKAFWPCFSTIGIVMVYFFIHLQYPPKTQILTTKLMLLLLAFAVAAHALASLPKRTNFVGGGAAPGVPPKMPG